MEVSRLGEQTQFAADSPDPLPQLLCWFQLLVLDMVLEGCEIQNYSAVPSCSNLAELVDLLPEA